MRTRLPRPPRSPLLPLAALVLGLAAARGPAAGAPDEAAAQCRQLGRGINAFAGDPIWGSFDRARFRQEHFALVRAGGFESLRVNLNPFAHMGGAPGYLLEPSWWRTLDWIVAQAGAARLAVVLDLHEFEALGRDPEGNRARFLAFWAQAAPHFRDAPPSVLFEILNEPNTRLTPPLWNEYLAGALALIRQSNPDRAVVVGPANYNSASHLDELSLPDGDRHLIVTVHYYQPMEFTHQGASWTKTRYPVGTRWEGTAAERAVVARDFARVQAWAEQHRRPIFLGEFGAYDKADMASRARYTDCVARTAESLGWSWAYWQFDGDFIAYDFGRGAWVPEIHGALVPDAGRPARPGG